MFLRQSNFTLFSPLLPSFADNIVKIDHSHDADLLKIYRNVNAQFFPASYSPPPEQELATYETLSADTQHYMLIRNPLLLSRLFIRNADLSELNAHFKNKNEIRILDIGCGYAANLMGILTYFGADRVTYLGVDISKENIQTASLAYSKFNRVSFIAQDAISLLENLGKYKNSFDLILVQHPNFQFEATQTVFTKIFLNLKHALADDGITYSTFYSKSEIDYFQQYVQPHLIQFAGVTPIETRAYDENAKFVDAISQEKQAAEQFVMLSNANRNNLRLGKL